jgi:hypothetical protein
MSLPSAQPGELVYSITQQPPTTGAGADGFAASSPLTWRFRPPPGRYWCPSESYLEVQLSVSGNDAVAGTVADATGNLQINTGLAANQQSVAPLAPACLFDSMSFDINSTQVESLNSNVAQAAAIRFRLSNASEQRAEGKFACWGISDRMTPVPASARGADDAADTTAAAASNTAAYVTVAAAAFNGGGGATRYPVAVSLGTRQIPVTQTAADRQAIFNASRVQTFALKLPLALFHQTKVLPAADFTIRAQLTSNFARVLQTVAATHEHLVQATGAGANNALVRVLGLDMMLAYSDYGQSGLLSGKYVIPYDALWITNYTLSTTTNADTINISGVPPTAVKIGFALQRASAGSANGACSPTEFHVSRAIGRDGLQPIPAAIGQNTIFGITSFQAQIGARTAPQPSAIMRFSRLENNMAKWYKRFELASGLEEPEDIDQWLSRGPIYMEPSLQIKSPDDRATDCIIRMERDNTAAGNVTDGSTGVAGVNSTTAAIPTNLIMFALAEKNLVVELRGGEVVAVDQEDR